MFGFIKKCFLQQWRFLVVLKCVSMNNQECKIRPKMININSNKPSFYPHSIDMSRCSGSCNNINDT